MKQKNVTSETESKNKIGDPELNQLQLCPAIPPSFTNIDLPNGKFASRNLVQKAR